MNQWIGKKRWFLPSSIIKYGGVPVNVPIQFCGSQQNSSLESRSGSMVSGSSIHMRSPRLTAVVRPGIMVYPPKKRRSSHHISEKLALLTGACVLRRVAGWVGLLGLLG